MPNMPKWYAPPQDKIVQKAAELALGDAVYQKTRKAAFQQTLFYTIASVFYAIVTLPLIISHLLTSNPDCSRLKRIGFTIQNFIRSLINIAGFPIYLITALVIPKTMAKNFSAIPLSSFSKDAKGAPNIGQAAAQRTTQVTPHSNKHSSTPASIWKEDDELPDTPKYPLNSKNNSDNTPPISEGNPPLMAQLGLIRYNPDLYEIIEKMGSYLNDEDDHRGRTWDRKHYDGQHYTELALKCGCLLKNDSITANSSSNELDAGTISPTDSITANSSSNELDAGTLNLTDLIQCQVVEFISDIDHGRALRHIKLFSPNLSELTSPNEGSSNQPTADNWASLMRFEDVCISAKKEDGKICVSIHASKSLMESLSDLTETQKSYKQLGAIHYFFNSIDDLKENKNVLTFLFHYNYSCLPIHSNWFRMALTWWNSIPHNPSFIRYSGLLKDKPLSPLQHAVGDFLGSSPTSKKELKSLFQYLALDQKFRMLLSNPAAKAYEYGQLIEEIQKLCRKKGSSRFAERYIAPLLNAAVQKENAVATESHTRQRSELLTAPNIQNLAFTPASSPRGSTCYKTPGNERVDAHREVYAQINELNEIDLPQLSEPQSGLELEELQDILKNFNTFYDRLFDYTKNNLLCDESKIKIKEMLLEALTRLHLIKSIQIEKDNKEVRDTFNTLCENIFTKINGIDSPDVEVSCAFEHLIETVGGPLLEKLSEKYNIDPHSIDLERFKREKFYQTNYHKPSELEVPQSLLLTTLHSAQRPRIAQDRAIITAKYNACYSKHPIPYFFSSPAFCFNPDNNTFYVTFRGAEHEKDSTYTHIEKILYNSLKPQENQDQPILFPTEEIKIILDNYRNQFNELAEKWTKLNTQSDPKSKEAQITQLIIKRDRLREAWKSAMHQALDKLISNGFKQHSFYANLEKLRGKALDDFPSIWQDYYPILKFSIINRYNTPPSLSFDVLHKMIAILGSETPISSLSFNSTRNPMQPINFPALEMMETLFNQTLRRAFINPISDIQLNKHIIEYEIKRPISTSMEDLYPLTPICDVEGNITSQLLCDRLFSYLSFNPVGSEITSSRLSYAKTLRGPSLFLNLNRYDPNWDPDGLTALKHAYHIWGAYPALHLRALEDHSIFSSLHSFLSPLSMINDLLSSNEPNPQSVQTVMRSHIHRAHALRSLLFHAQNNHAKLSPTAQANLAKVDTFLFELSRLFTQTIMEIHNRKREFIDSSRLLIILGELLLAVYLTKDRQDPNIVNESIFCLTSAFYKLLSHHEIYIQTHENTSIIEKNSKINEIIKLFKIASPSDYLPGAFFTWLCDNFNDTSVTLSSDAAGLLHLPSLNNENDHIIYTHQGYAYNAEDPQNASWTLDLLTGKITYRNGSSWLIYNDENMPRDNHPKNNRALSSIFSSRTSAFALQGSAYTLTGSDGTFTVEDDTITWETSEKKRYTLCLSTSPFFSIDGTTNLHNPDGSFLVWKKSGSNDYILSYIQRTETTSSLLIPVAEIDPTGQTPSLLITTGWLKDCTIQGHSHIDRLNVDSLTYVKNSHADRVISPLVDAHGNPLIFTHVTDDGDLIFQLNYHGKNYNATNSNLAQIAIKPHFGNQDNSLPYIIFEDAENHNNEAAGDSANKDKHYLLCLNLSSIIKGSSNTFLENIIPEVKPGSLGRYINIPFHVNKSGLLSFNKKERSDYLAIVILHLLSAHCDFKIVLETLREYTERCFYPLSKDEYHLLECILRELTCAGKDQLDSAGLQALMLARMYYEGYSPDKPLTFKWDQRLPKTFAHFDFSNPFLPHHLPFVPSESHLPHYFSSLQKLSLTPTIYERRELAPIPLRGDMLFSVTSLLDPLIKASSALPQGLQDKIEEKLGHLQQPSPDGNSSFGARIIEGLASAQSALTNGMPNIMLGMPPVTPYDPTNKINDIKTEANLNKKIEKITTLIKEIQNTSTSNSTICTTLIAIANDLCCTISKALPSKKEKKALRTLAEAIEKLAQHPDLSLPLNGPILDIIKTICPSRTFALPLFLAEWIKVWLCERSSTFQGILKATEFKENSSFFTTLASNTDFVNWSGTVRFQQPATLSITDQVESPFITSFMPSKNLAMNGAKPTTYTWPNASFIKKFSLAQSEKLDLSQEEIYFSPTELFEPTSLPTTLDDLISEITDYISPEIKILSSQGSCPPFASSDLLRLFMSKNNETWKKTLGVTNDDKINRWKDNLALILEEKIRSSLNLQPNQTVHSWLSQKDEHQLWAQYPHILAFEAISGKTLRQNQVETIQGLVKWDDQEGFVFQNTFYQLMMGAGKTKVITPLIALIYATAFPDKIPFMTYTAPLFASCTVDLQQTLKPFGIKVKALSLNRTHLETVAGARITLFEIARAYETGHTILTCQAKDIQLLFSMMPILHTQLKEARNELKNLSNKNKKNEAIEQQKEIDTIICHITFVARILKLTTDKALFTLDEMDHVLYPLHELILSLGQKQTPSDVELKTNLHVNLELLKIPLFRQKIQNDELSLLSTEEKSTIKKELAQKLFTNWSIQAKLRLSLEEWLSYLCINKNQNLHKVNSKVFTSLAKNYTKHEELVDQVALLRFILEDAFDALCDKKSGVSHGLSPFSPNQLISTPWRDGAPQQNSQFQNSIMTILLTNFLCLVQTSFSPLFTKTFIRFCIMKVYNSKSKPHDRIYELKLLQTKFGTTEIDWSPFESYMNQDDLNESHIEISDEFVNQTAPVLLKIKDNALSSDEFQNNSFISWFLECVTNKISGDQVQIYPEIVQSNSADLLAISHHLKSPSSQGFSGTTSATGWVPESALKKNEDQTIVSNIQKALNIPAKCRVCKENDIPHGWNISSFIDLGAQKRRDPILTTVIKLTEKHPGKKYFLYYDENETGQTVVHVWNRDAQQSIPLEGSDHEKIAEACGVSLTDFKEFSFCFYPFQNIIGSDLPNPSGGAAIVTFDDATDERLLAQAVMRMRELIDGKDRHGNVMPNQGGQKIIFQITDLVSTKIKETLNINSNTDLTVDHLFKYAKHIEETNDAQFNLTGTINRLKAVIRSEIHQSWFNLFETSSDLTADQLLSRFDYFEKFLVAQTLESPFIRFGAPTKEGSPLKLLSLVVKKIEESLKVIQSQDPILHTKLIHKLKAEHKKVLSELHSKKFKLPDSVKQNASSDDGDGSVTVSTETSVAVQTETVHELELEAEKMIINTKTPTSTLQPFKLPFGEKYFTLPSIEADFGAKTWSADTPPASKDKKVVMFNSLMTPVPLFDSNRVNKIQQDVIADLNAGPFFNAETHKNLNSLIESHPEYGKKYKTKMISDNIYVSNQLFNAYQKRKENQAIFMTGQGQPMQYLMTVEDQKGTYAIIVRPEEAECIKTALDYYTNMENRPSLTRKIALFNIHTRVCLGSTLRENVQESSENEIEHAPDFFELSDRFLFEIYLITYNRERLADFYGSKGPEVLDRYIQSWKSEINLSPTRMKNQYEKFAPLVSVLNAYRESDGRYFQNTERFEIYDKAANNIPFLSNNQKTGVRNLFSKIFSDPAAEST